MVSDDVTPEPTTAPGLLGAARAARNDEFYTQWVDIEREMNAYLEFDADVFRDRVILLPCDDPEWSNFTKFFALHFTDTPVVDYRTMAAANRQRTRDLFLGLVNHGVLLAPRAMGALSTPMMEQDIQEFIDAVDTVVAEQRLRWESEN